MHCRFGVREGERDGDWTPDPDGCPAHLSAAEAATHEAACDYAFETCPWSGCGVERRRRDADAHDAAAAQAHARGERDARLASEAAARAQVAALEARLPATEGATTGRSGAPRVATGATFRAELRGHSGYVYACAWSPDGNTVVSASGDGTLRLWDVATSQRIATLGRRGGSVIGSCSWSPDGRTIAAGNFDKKVKLWKAWTTGSAAELPKKHSLAVNSLAWSPDRHWLASAGGDFKLWNAATRLCVATEPQQSTSIFCACAWNRDSRTVVLGSFSGVVALWDVATRSIAKALRGHHTNWVYAVAWSPLDGSAFVSASNDKTLKLWSAAPSESLTCTNTLSGHTASVKFCAWSPDGLTIASGSMDKTLRLWNAATGQECCAALAANSLGTVVSCAWSPNGSMIACCGSKNTVVLWDVQR